MHSLEEKITHQENLIAELQQKIFELETSVDEDADYGTVDSYYGMKRNKPETREEMAIEFFDVFEELFSVHMSAEDLNDPGQFKDITDEAGSLMQSMRESVSRLYQDFIFAQYMRKEKSGNFVFADALSERNAMIVIGALEMMGEYFSRTEQLYRQMQRRAEGLL